MYKVRSEKSIVESVFRVLQSSELEETVARVEVAAGFGRSPIDSEIASARNFIPHYIDAKTLEKFWNFNRDKIAELFTYNPVEKYLELKSPDEDRIDATAFSIVLASVIEPNDEITLSGKTNATDSSPLVDNLAAYMSQGKVTIYGETGDGTAHHAGPDAYIRLLDKTGDNLGFGSHEDATIYASSAAGPHIAPNVGGPIPTLLRLHE